MTKDLVTERLKLKDIHPGWAKDLAKENKIDVDDLELVRKGVIADKTETDHDGVISFISMEGPDRDNEEMDPDGAILTFFNKNKVVPYGHDYRGLPVGKNIWIQKATKNGKRGLLAKTIFLEHDFAREVGKLYTEDVAGTGPAMQGWSIGFIPLKWEEPEEKGKPPKEGEADTRPRRKYTKWELVEYSAVMIPSCREALTEMVEKGLIKSDKLKKDIEKFIEVEDGTPWLYTNEVGTLVTQEEILEEWIEKEVVTKPEETDDYIRLPAKGEQGKHKGHKIRWITVSEKQGIKGIYCIDDKIIITYVFLKSKGWNLKKAKKWMDEHGKNIERIVDAWVQTDAGTRFEDTAWLALNQKLESYDSELTGDREVIELEDKDEEPVSYKAKPKEDFEYLLHHIETDDDGEEEIHHCFVLDHIANLFEQAHLLIKDGKVYLDGKEIKEGLFHVIKGLESTQETVWSDEEAKENKIKPKKMKAGMTLKEKSKEW